VFTCFTGTKVQILTRDKLLRSARTALEQQEWGALLVAQVRHLLALLVQEYKD
jgi:hypothetical protein